jgi:hypothetical protein
MHRLVFNPFGSSHKGDRIILPCQMKLPLKNGTIIQSSAAGREYAELKV